MTCFKTTVLEFYCRTKLNNNNINDDNNNNFSLHIDKVDYIFTINFQIGFTIKTSRTKK